ncbi:hypothetical protein ACLBVW_20900, partial [Pseudomonas aeruginosa]|uniref:hypothetical protein n=1 Tax=Pseudomonas aeruginosa TaxID=287 RepID=UPI00396A5C17
MIAKWTAALLMGALAWGSCTAQAEEARPPVADKVVAYQGQQGLKVWTLRIGEAAAGEALLQVEGLDHDWDRLIHKVKVEKSARDSRYSTELNGSKYVILIVRDGWGELYLPGEQQTLQVAYRLTLLL